MEHFTVDALQEAHRSAGKLYLEFLRHPSLSMGLYKLPAGGKDPQQPHTEDEVYYVVSGKASISVAGEDQAVASGSIVFVAAEVEHTFHSIEEDLTVLVVFAPAEYSQAPKEGIGLA